MYGKKIYALRDEPVNNTSKLLCICWWNNNAKFKKTLFQEAANF